MNKLVKSSFITLFVIALLLGLLVRAYFLFYHFTHIDDIGVAVTILQNETLLLKFLSFQGWTYAPLQYLIEVPLLYLGNTYQSLIVLGRLPSFLLGIINIFLCHQLLSKYLSTNILVLFGDIVLLLSWENIIYGSQMEPYIIAVTFIMFHLYLFYIWEKEIFEIRKRLLLILSVGVLSCYAHYQLFIFVFALYSSLLLLEIKKKKNRYIGPVLLVGVINALLCFPLLYFLIRHGFTELGVNWNSGIEEQFLFNVSGSDNVIKYTVFFFLSNFKLIIQYFFTSNYPIISIVLTICFIIIMFYGFIRIHIEKNRTNDLIKFYIDIIIFLYIFLIIRGSLTFGPSRHNLVLFPLLLYLLVYGLYQINKKLSKKNQVLMNTSLLFLVVLNIWSFGETLKEEVKYRSNYVSEQELSQIVEKYKPYAIMSNPNFCDLSLMRIEGYSDKSIFCQYGLLLKDKKDIEDCKNIVLLSNVRFDKDLYRQVFNDEIKDDYDIKCPFEQFEEIINRYSILNREVEYASHYFSNFPNNYYMYIGVVDK